MSTADDKPAKMPPEKHDGVRHDARGNAVWQWAVESGKHAIESTSRLLKRLEVPGLKLEDDDATSPGPKPGADPKAGPAGGAQRAPGKPERAVGYNPYGTRTGAKTPAARPAARPTPPRKPGAAVPLRPSFWQRLFRKR